MATVLTLFVIAIEILTLIAIIIFVFFMIKKRKAELAALAEAHKVHRPHLDLAAVQRFIEAGWAKGFTIPEIKSELIDRGWDPRLINRILAQLRK